MSLMFALSLIVTSELSIQNGKVEEFLSIVTAGLEVSRNFSGNQSFDIYVEKDSPEKVLFIERWESEVHFQKHYQWRLKQGDFQLLQI
jgi:quinol monooxygenase YgiN